VTSIERTAYPQFKKLTSARVLHVFFTPTAEETAWSRRCLELEADVEPDHGAVRTAKLHRKQVRDWQGVKYDKAQARAIAAAAIRKTAKKKNHPPDLINVALEKLLEASLELPGFSTLDEMATRIRAEVNAEIFALITRRMGTDGRQRTQALLSTAGLDGRSMFNRLKKPVGVLLRGPRKTLTSSPCRRGRRARWTAVRVKPYREGTPSRRQNPEGSRSSNERLTNANENLSEHAAVPAKPFIWPFMFR
jgi:Domain of unknown function (DUF4158)